MGRLRRAVVSFLALAAMAGSAAAQARVTLDARVKQKYYGLNNAVFQDGPVVQPHLHAMFNRGLYLEIGGSLGGRRQGIFGNEMEATAGFMGRLRDFTVDMGVSYYALRGRDILVPHLEVGRGVRVARRVALKPFARVEFPVPLKEDGPRAGTFLKAGSDVALTLGEPLEVEAKSTFIVDVDGAFGFDPGTLFRQYVGANWRVTRNLTLILPAVTVGGPVSRLEDGRKREVVWEGGFRYRF